jgi:hypothetical protein
MHRFRRLQLAAALVAGVCASGSKASSIPMGTYALNGVTVDGFQIDGTMTLDTNGFVNAADIQLMDPEMGNPTATSVLPTGVSSGSAPADVAVIGDPGVGQLDIAYLTTPNGGGELQLCILAANDCSSSQASFGEIYNLPGYGAVALDLASGSLDPVSSAAASPTPEVGTLALLGTAILGIAVITRCRKRSMVPPEPSSSLPAA